MKKSISIILLFLGIFYSLAQAPNAMSYQAVVRNAGNALIINQNVGIKISILQTYETGTAVYVENQTATTNQNGLFSISIGSGVPLTGNFSTIDWSTNAPYFIKTEIDPIGGSNYTISSTSRLLSVPYALYAKNAGNASNGFSVPYSGTVSTNNPAFKITNNGTSTGSTAIVGDASGAGTAVSASAESGNAVHAESSSGSAVYGFSSSGKGGEFETDGNYAGVSGFSSDGPGGEFSSNTGLAVKANGNIDIAGTVKIAGGNPGAGKVLTSDASGNASWKSSAYNNVERFQFFLYKKAGNTNDGILETIYNTGTVIAGSQASYSNPKKSLIVNINNPGLYHFEFSGYGNPTALTSIFYSVSMDSNFVLDQIPIDNTSNVKYFYASLEVYISSPKSIWFNVNNFDGASTMSYYKFVVRGHKISD